MNNHDSCADQCLLTLPNDYNYLPAALSFIRHIAIHLGFNETDLNHIEIAVEEAASNVIQHAYSAEEKASFDIVCQRVAGGLEIIIHDMGIPWDPTLDEHYDPDADLDHQSGKGLGKFLINYLMDEYAFDNLGHDGKQIRLIKYLGTNNVAEGMTPRESNEISYPPETKPEPVELEFRLMKPEEAIEVSRAIFDCYGYSYAGEFMYYPERIDAMNANGTMLSAVAVTKESGEVAGHNALLFNPSLPAELAVAVTKQKFRGLGIARTLGDFLAEQAKERGLRGIYVKEVTVHPYTQKFCKKLGFNDCGFLLAHSPKSLAFKGISDEAKQRNSDLLGYQQIFPAAARTLYLPQQHASVIEAIYANLSIPMSYSCIDEPPVSSEKTVMKATTNSARSLCEIHIPHYGGDLIKMLKQELRRIRRHEIQLVELYLSLTHPATPWVLSEAEKLGFFFTGIMPETINGDAAILQFFNGIMVDYDQLTIDQAKTAELLNYVVAQDPTMV